ncbi:uncharacterized protein [Primulina eburnea]|uniref:uncharacterized protein n=1 Tax=Primulina eburnea TaxID=1245227 RepID=UPI003C6CAEF4
MFSRNRKVFYNGSLASGSANRDVVIKIEHKIFSLRLGSGGGSIWWSERTRNSCYMLDFDRQEAHWIQMRFLDAINSSQLESPFFRLRGRNAVFTVQIFSNKRGRFLELSKYCHQGKKQTTIVPSGIKSVGWRTIATSLGKMRSGNHQKGTSMNNQGPITRKPFKDTYRANRVHRDFSSQGKISHRLRGLSNLNKKWEEALIVTKSKVTISWEDIQKALGKTAKKNVKLFLFQANKAVWWPSNQDEYSFHLRIKRGFFDKGIMLDFEGWKQDINSAFITERCCNSWISIYGLPWNLWKVETFKTIGNLCGGLLDISEHTLSISDLEAARIKVKGIEGGFINSRMYVPIHGELKEISIRVETFDPIAYQQYDNRTYAQVVVNGKRTLAGWGDNNIRRIRDFQDCNRAEQIPETLHTSHGKEPAVVNDYEQRKFDPVATSSTNEASKVSASKEKTQLSPDNKDDTTTASIREILHLSPKNKGLDHASSADSKVVKILSRVVPKDLNEFQHSQINTMPNSPPKILISEEGVVSSRASPKFEITYQRRKRSEESAIRYKFGTQGINEQINSSPIKSFCDMIGTEDKDVEGAHDNMSEDDLLYSDSDSHVSSRSELSTTLEDKLEDLAALFSSPNKSGDSKTLQHTVIASSNVGQSTDLE